MPLISNCSMMPAWHQLVSMSGHVEESETARKLQLYATSIYQVHSFVCQLDYNVGFGLQLVASIIDQVQNGYSKKNGDFLRTLESGFSNLLVINSSFF